jgi:DNA mismatch repair ATPase MutL
MKKSIFLALFLAILALSACSGGEADPNNLEQEATSDEETTGQTSEEADATESSDTESADSSEGNSEENPESNEENDEGEATEEANDSEESEEDSESADEEGSEDASKSEDTQAEQTSSVGLKAYMPEGPMTKTFMQGEYEGVYEIVDVKGSYVQRVITFGDMVTMQVLEYKDETISVVYEESNPADVSPQLDALEPVESIEVLVDVTGNESDGETWTILDKKQTTETKVGEFENVFVVKRESTGEASGVKTTLTQYYAPGYGLIKEQMEDHGDNGYKVNTELTQLEE